MFVRDFIHVDQPFQTVAPRFVSDTSWLAPIAEEAAAIAHDVAAQLAPRTHGRDRAVGRDSVRCELGPVRARADGILVPLWLIADRSEAGLPDLTGDLEVAPVGAARSLIALGATYPRPAPEPEALRRVERAAEAGVRSFLNGIAAALARPVGV
jgi:hypothetical protein